MNMSVFLVLDTVSKPFNFENYSMVGVLVGELVVSSPVPPR